MRFTAFAAAALAALAVVSAAPIATEKRSLITDIGKMVSAAEEKLGITAIEDALDKFLGGGLTELEDKLGVSFAEKILGLAENNASPGDLQAIGKGIYFLEKGLGVEDIDAFLDQETGGAVTSIEDALGVTDVEKAIGATA